MTAKPRKSKSGRNFGTRRQYRRSRGKFGPFYSLDFETRAFVGVDFGTPFSTLAVLMRGAAGDLRVLDMVRLPSDVEQAESRLHRSPHRPPVEVKVYPYQLNALAMLSEGGQLAPLTSRTGRTNAYMVPPMHNLRPVLSEEQQAYRDAIWAAMRKSLGLEAPENRDETDTG